jgi:hypothetical protein
MTNLLTFHLKDCESTDMSWAIVYFGQFFKLQKVARIFGVLFPQKMRCNNCQKNGFGDILGVFSQTHLATLTRTPMEKSSPDPSYETSNL